jgi:hypothetical protein
MNTETGLDIVAEHASLLLIRGREGFAVVERRNGRIYPMRDGKRDGAEMVGDQVTELLGDEDWRDEAQARQLFAEFCERGDQLARILR